MSLIKELLTESGSSKPIGIRSADPKKPHYFLLRRFKGENDLLIIFNGERCRYQCRFCNLPTKNTHKGNVATDLKAQFRFVLTEIRHALDIVTRVTLSNEGSVLDFDTFPRSDMLFVLEEIASWRSVKEVVFETRLEFATEEILLQLNRTVPHKRLIILTGFESSNVRIRDIVLAKRETLGDFCKGLDVLGKLHFSLTAYVLYKPDAIMTDEEADADALHSIDWLVEETQRRGIPLSIRLNLMYVAEGTPWARELNRSTYRPPSLEHALAIARQTNRRGVECYIGLSSEGLSEANLTYRAREDFDRALLKQAVQFNLDK